MATPRPTLGGDILQIIGVIAIVCAIVWLLSAFGILDLISDRSAG